MRVAPVDPQPRHIFPNISIGLLCYFWGFMPGIPLGSGQVHPSKQEDSGIHPFPPHHYPPRLIPPTHQQALSLPLFCDGASFWGVRNLGKCQTLVPHPIPGRERVFVGFVWNHVPWGLGIPSWLSGGMSETILKRHLPSLQFTSQSFCFKQNLCFSHLIAYIAKT